MALLRGINVGGRHKLPMKDVVRFFEEAGCDAVRTYIQSGNVVYEAPLAAASAVPSLVTAAIAERHGFAVPVVTRRARELAAAVRRNPYPDTGADERELHVVFLAEPPAPDRLARLDPDRSPPDELTVVGREIYLRCPNGMGRSKLTNAYFDATLDTISTVRNWRTTLKLHELAGD